MTRHKVYNTMEEYRAAQKARAVERRKNPDGKYLANCARLMKELRARRKAAANQVQPAIAEVK